MKNEQITLNYLGFLATPPTSGRTEMCNSQYGGCTTRRSASKIPQNNFNGIYEGDFTIFDESIKDIAFKTSCADYNQPMMDQYLGPSLDLGLEQQEEQIEHMDHIEQLDDETDEMVDEEIRAKMTVPQKPVEKKVESFWEQYKSFIFTVEQIKNIETAIEKLNHNTMFRKMTFTVKCVTVITVWILRLLLCSVIMRSLDLCCTALRRRNFLRSGTRRMLWYMTLSKCGDLQLYGLIMLLSPLLFLVAFLGFIFSSYCEIKNGISAAISHVRYRLDVEPPKFD